MVNINTNDPYSTNYNINFLIGKTIIVTKEFLKSGNVPDIGSNKISSENYIHESRNITQEQTDNIMFPELSSPLQQVFKS